MLHTPGARSDYICQLLNFEMYFIRPSSSDLLEIQSGHNEVMLLEIVNIKSMVWRIGLRKTGIAAEMMETNVNDSYKITQRASR